jgi:hypothetical protein
MNLWEQFTTFIGSWLFWPLILGLHLAH